MFHFVRNGEINSELYLAAQSYDCLLLGFFPLRCNRNSLRLEKVMQK